MFQLSFGILGVLILGLFNRLLIEDLRVPAALAALAIGAQQLMGFTRAWFGYRSDLCPVGRLRRTPFILLGSLSCSVLFGSAGWVVLQLAHSMDSPQQSAMAGWLALLVLISMGIGTAVAAAGTAFSALVADLSSEQERPRVLSVVWGMRLVGVLLGTVLVNQTFGAACDAGASRDAVMAGLQRLILVTPPILFALGLASVLGLEHPVQADDRGRQPPLDQPTRLALLQLLGRLRTVPQAGRFMALLCLLTFSMFFNDAVLEPYGAAVFGMSVCATTSLNALIAVGFFGGLGLSGFQLIERIGTIRTARGGALLAVAALSLMLLAAPGQTLGLLRIAITLFGVSLGICINACLTLMFSFVEPGRTGFLLGVWGVGFAYSCGLATISGGGVLTLFQMFSGGNVEAAYSGVFLLQILCFLAVAVMTRRLNVVGFRSTVQSRFASMAEALD